MKKFMYLIIPALMLVMTSFSGCDNPNNPVVFTVEGTIVSILFPCQGNGNLISVENIQNFGETGSFRYGGLDSLINYQNAIFVPILDKSIKGIDKITSPTSAGDKLKFECRVKTDADDYLFYSNVKCPAHLIPPSAPRYIVTKILNYQKQ